MIAWNEFQLLVGIKVTKKDFEAQVYNKPAEIGLEIKFFHFLKFGSLVSHLKCLDDRSGPCRTASRKNEKINFGPKTLVEITFFAIFSSLQH